MKYKNITIAGSGVLGSQNAFQSAFFGFNESVFDINDGAIETAKGRMKNLQEVYSEYFDDQQRAQKAYDSLGWQLVKASMTIQTQHTRTQIS